MAHLAEGSQSLGNLLFCLYFLSDPMCPWASHSCHSFPTVGCMPSFTLRQNKPFLPKLLSRSVITAMKIKVYCYLKGCV